MAFLAEYAYLVGLGIGVLITLVSVWLGKLLAKKPAEVVVKESVWDRPPVISHSSLGPILQVQIPAKQDFINLWTCLKAAEKADIDGDFEFRDHLLGFLIDCLKKKLKAEDAEE